MYGDNVNTLQVTLFDTLTGNYSEHSVVLKHDHENALIRRTEERKRFKEKHGSLIRERDYYKTEAEQLRILLNQHYVDSNDKSVQHLADAFAVCDIEIAGLHREANELTNKLNDLRHELKAVQQSGDTATDSLKKAEEELGKQAGLNDFYIPEGYTMYVNGGHVQIRRTVS